MPERVLISRRDPDDLSEIQKSILRKVFGQDVSLERTEISDKDITALSKLEHPIVLLITAETKWDVSSPRPTAKQLENIVTVRMSDGHYVALIPL